MSTVIKRQMMSWMLILLNLFLSVGLRANCELKHPERKIISLSGPVTILFKEIGLLNSLEGISIFHPIPRSKFKGRVYPGGIFLASKTLESLKTKIIFFDESRELRHLLATVESALPVEVKTRNLVPHEVSELVVKELSPFLKGCEKALLSFVDKTRALEKSLLGQFKTTPKIVFFVGDMVMAHDGVVIFLKQNKKIQTYPSELSYVSWSAKMMNQMKDFKKIYLKDSSPRLIKENPDASLEVTYPGILIPGLTQVEGFRFLFSGDQFVKP